MINIWGFCNFMGPFGIGILWLVLSCLCCAWDRYSGKSECLIALVAFLFACLVASYVSHYITMAVMRLRHAGRVCSGDFDSDFSLFELGVQKQPY